MEIFAKYISDKRVNIRELTQLNSIKPIINLKMGRESEGLSDGSAVKKLSASVGDTRDVGLI